MIARLLIAALLLVGSSAAAEDLPVNIQVQLLSKMSTYIPNMQPPAGTPIKILVVHPGTAPTRGAQALVNAIKQAGKFGTFDTETKLHGYVDAAQLKSAHAAEKPQIIYLASEVDEKAAREIVDAAAGTKSVTISSVSEHPKLGVMLGFSLLEARPRVLVNLKQARKENVEFKNQFLTHCIVVEK